METVALFALPLLLALLLAWAWPKVVGPWLESMAWHTLATRAGLTHHRRRVLGIPRHGRISGTYRGRELTLSAFKDMGVDLTTRVVLSVDNRAHATLLVVAKVPERGAAQGATQPFDQLFTVAESQPADLAQEAFTPPERCAALAQMMRDHRSHQCHIELRGRMLRFEHRPRRLCFYRVRARADRLAALIDGLCAVAETVERVDER
jgi:hypothetical protein